ncbi:ATP-binding protein [Klebsiella pneumoniae]|nr:ATP-binding protein [Klebsiella pneumoniae]
MILWPVTCRLDASVAVAFKAAVSREIFAANDRVTLRFIDAGEVFPAERLALARGDERFDVDPLAESGRGLRLILRAVDYFNVETRAGENVTTLIKALPDAVLRHSTDDRVR